VDGAKQFLERWLSPLLSLSTCISGGSHGLEVSYEEINMSDYSSDIQFYAESKSKMLAVVEQVLNEWQSTGNMQLPILLGRVKIKMGWDDKELKANDPIIRDFLSRFSSKYCIARGPFGGVARRVDRQAKIALALAKRQAIADAKAEVEAALQAKLANP